jgi:hypothetical protein
MVIFDDRAVVRRLRLGYSLHVEASQEGGFAAALLLEDLEFVLGLVELAAQVGLVAHDLVQFIADRQVKGLASRVRPGILGNLRLAQHLAGHENIRTTSAYCHVTPRKERERLTEYLGEARGHRRRAPVDSAGPARRDAATGRWLTHQDTTQEYLK